MSHSQSFRALMDRLKTGEDQAAQAVFVRFANQLIAMTRRQFDQRLAHKIDPEDVVQSAYKSFFLRHRDGLLTVENWDNLWSLLCMIAMRKCVDRVEYHTAQRRSVNRETAAGGDTDHPAAWQLALDREPLPDEAAVLGETVEELFAAVDVHERPILELSLQGYTVPEICDQLGRAERSVRRLRERIRKRLERQQGEE